MKKGKSIPTPLDRLDVRTTKIVIISAVLAVWITLALCVNAPEPIRTWALMWSGLGCFIG